MPVAPARGGSGASGPAARGSGRGSWGHSDSDINGARDTSWGSGGAWLPVVPA